MALTEDAKAELREAIRIVREDKFESHARGVLSRFAPKEDPPKNDGPPKDPKLIDPPPKQDDPPKKEDDPPKRSAYWGELLND